ncbi:MAG: T9SS type A sorting domain-containing protein [Saprospiraceae bacterium]
MKTILINFILLFLLQNTKAQELQYAPTGARWTYSIQQIFPLVTKYNEWISIGDTLIQNHSCQIVQRIGDVTIEDFADKVYVYNDHRIVYLFNFSEDEFSILYDFNKEAGESWITKINSCETVMHVDSTGVENINGFALKSMYITKVGFGTYAKLLEHIGSLTSFSPYDHYFCENLIIDGTSSAGIRCYEDTIIGFHNFNPSVDCDYISSSKDAATQRMEIKIYPNPFSTQANVEFPRPLNNAKCSIYNSIGQKVQEVDNISGKSFQLQSEKLSAGQYLLVVTEDSEIIGTERFVISDQ